MEAAPPSPSPPPLLNPAWGPVSGTLGQLEDRDTNDVWGCGSPELVSQCPVLSAGLFQPRLHLEAVVEATNFKLIQFL